MDITLGDAVGAVRQTDAAYDESTTAVGFLTDYTFSDEELWDGSTTGLTTITLSGITQDADYNDVTITQKPITILGIQVDDKVYDGGTSSDEHFSPVNSNL